MRSRIFPYYLFAVLAVLLCIQPAWSVGAWSESGLVGDEWFHYRADTASSFTRAQAARLASMRRVQQEQQAIQATFPLTGQVRSLVILVSYTDIQFTVANAREAFTRMLNEEGYSANGGTGSAADYFRACSYGAFKPAFDVVGPYVLPNDRAYYGENNDKGNDKNAQQMVVDACLLADANGVDFSQYDYNNDGQVDNVFVYYAGTNPAEGGPESAVWPHRSVVRKNLTLDGKKIYDYACSSELTLSVSKTGTMCGIGTFCHEFGHVLGLKDLYNTSDGKVYTVGAWDIMAGGNYNNNGCTPPSYTAYERFILGWLTPTQLENAGDYTLSPLCEKPEAYLIAATTHNLKPLNPQPTEYWLVENRQHVGWDTPVASIPGVGLLITRICHNANHWNDNTYNNTRPLGFDVCEAYNKSATRASASDTYPGTAGIKSFTPTQSNGVELTELQLTKIAEKLGYMEFHFGGADGSGFALNPAEMPQLINYVLNGASSPQAQTLEITGKKLATDKMYVVLSNNKFSMSADGFNWQKDTLWLPVTSEQFTTKIHLRYEGTLLCQKQLSNLLISTATHTHSMQITLIGYAERPMIITDVDVLSTATRSPYSFVARWREQADAEVYYLTLCKWRDEPNEMTQDFEQFLTQEKIAASGWQCNFLRTTSTSYDGRTALLMTTAGDRVISERYLAPVTRVSFWLSQTYSSAERGSGGMLRLEASADGKRWDIVAEQNVYAVTQSTVRSYDFDQENNYVMFRLTCTLTNGTGGIILDSFTARMERTFEYVYRDTDFPIYAPADSVMISGLQPATTYSYQLKCAEDKGCTHHVTELSLPKYITTAAGESESSGKMTVVVRDNDMSIYLSSLFVSGAVLYFYDLSGRLVTTVHPLPGTDECRVPISLLERGKQYIVKLMNDAGEAPAMNRKQAYGKIVIPR